MMLFFAVLLGIERDLNLILSEHYKQTGLERDASKIQRYGLSLPIFPPVNSLSAHQNVGTLK